MKSRASNIIFPLPASFEWPSRNLLSSEHCDLKSVLNLFLGCRFSKITGAGSVFGAKNKKIMCKEVNSNKF
jgi:hypothetical protein